MKEIFTMTLGRGPLRTCLIITKFTDDFILGHPECKMICGTRGPYAVLWRGRVIPKEPQSSNSYCPGDTGTKKFLMLYISLGPGCYPRQMKEQFSDAVLSIAG
jgi:hypothetical protein